MIPGTPRPFRGQRVPLGRQTMDHRKMMRIAGVSGGVGLGLAILLGAGLQQGQPEALQPPDSELSAMALYPPAEIKWNEGPASLPPGAEIAVLEGDPSKAGPFVFRVKVPDGYTIPPHEHPKAERVTVIAGTFHIAEGEKIDKSAGQVLPAGSFGYWPTGMKHFAWVTGDTIVQFHGTGPWKISYLNPADDPRNADNSPRPDDAGAQQSQMITNQLVEAGCGSCIYSMNGVQGCKIAVKIDGKAYLVTGADHVDAHQFCSATKEALVSGQIEGSRFAATRLEIQP